MIMAQLIARKSASLLKNFLPFSSPMKITPRCISSKKVNITKQSVQENNRDLTYTEYDEGISITYGAESRQLLFHWLRDHCRSTTSYNHETHQKIILPHHIDSNIKPNTVDVEDNKLVIHWSEGLRSTYDPAWLLENSYPGPEERVPKFIWDDAAMLGEHWSSFAYEEFMQNEEGLKSFLRQLLKYGFAVVEGVLDDTGKANIETTRKAVQRVCDIQKTQLFGEVWSFTDDKALSDTAWTNVALGAHTDTTYFTVPSGIQVFHCLHHDGRGGDTLLVDGFHAAETLRHQDPKAFTELTEFRVEHEYKESFHGRVTETLHGHVRSLDPILKTHPVTGDLECIRYNHYDRAPIRTVPPKHMKTYYRALAKLSRKIESPRREHWLKLKPGMVLFVDNWRVLHGRSAFTGRRDICGCYLTRDDWMGRARCLGLIQ